MDVVDEQVFLDSANPSVARARPVRSEVHDDLRGFQALSDRTT